MERKATMKGSSTLRCQRLKSSKPVEASLQRAAMINTTAPIKTLFLSKVMPKTEQKSSAKGNRAKLKPTTSARCSKVSGSDSNTARVQST